MTPVRLAIEKAERYLERLDIERDKVVRHIVALKAIEHDTVNLLPRFPGRALKAELDAVRRQQRKEQRSA
jgi:hypothetical protein